MGGNPQSCLLLHRVRRRAAYRVSLAAATPEISSLAEVRTATTGTVESAFHRLSSACLWRSWELEHLRRRRLRGRGPTPAAIGALHRASPRGSFAVWQTPGTQHRRVDAAPGKS